VAQLERCAETIPHHVLGSYPFYSTRWHDFFSYAQVKTELHNKTRLQPYLSVASLATRGDGGRRLAQYFRKSLVHRGRRCARAAVARRRRLVRSRQRHELRHGPPVADYRGGLNYRARDWPDGSAPNPPAGSRTRPADAVFISRFGNDSWCTDSRGSATRWGRPRSAPSFFWNGNFHDRRAAADFGANYFETGRACAYVRRGCRPRCTFHHQPAVRPTHR